MFLSNVRIASSTSSPVAVTSNELVTSPSIIAIDASKPPHAKAKKVPIVKIIFYCGVVYSKNFENFTI